MQVWNVLHAARWKYRRQKNCQKICHLRTITQFCRAISSQLRHVFTIGKKLLNSNTSSTCPCNMVNVGPLTAEIGSLVWGTPANFYGFRFLASLLHHCLSTEVSQTLHDVWPSPGLVHFIYISRGSCLVTEFWQVQNSPYVQIVRSTLHGTRAVAVIQTLQRSAEVATYIRQDGHHIGHRPTF